MKEVNKNKWHRKKVVVIRRNKIKRSFHTPSQSNSCSGRVVLLATQIRYPEKILDLYDELESTSSEEEREVGRKTESAQEINEANKNKKHRNKLSTY